MSQEHLRPCCAKNEPIHFKCAKHCYLLYFSPTELAVRLTFTPGQQFVLSPSPPTCSILQHIAPYCSICRMQHMQHIAAYASYFTISAYAGYSSICNILQHLATYCSMCSILQHMQHTAAYATYCSICSILQHIVAYCTICNI